MSKEEQIKDYAVNMFLQLEEAGIYLKPEEQKAIVDPYLNSEEPLNVIISSMLSDISSLRGSHDQRNRRAVEEPTPVVEKEVDKTLSYRPPRANGFAATIPVAIAVGAFLGILLAFALLSIR